VSPIFSTCRYVFVGGIENDIHQGLGQGQASNEYIQEKTRKGSCLRILLKSAMLTPTSSSGTEKECGRSSWANLPVKDFPHILTSRHLRLIDFTLSITAASAYLCMLSLS
jgi:hypothetical protein